VQNKTGGNDHSVRLRILALISFNGSVIFCR
jgi:hypothetical protein